MKIRVATPIQFVPGRKFPNSPAPVPRAEPAALPTTIDLMRKLEFGDSEVDEAGVVLVEMSVLVYEPVGTGFSCCCLSFTHSVDEHVSVLVEFLNWIRRERCASTAQGRTSWP